MKTLGLVSSLSLVLACACGSAQTAPPAAAPPPPSASAAPSSTPPPAASASAAPSAAPAASASTPANFEGAHLKEDRAKWEEENKAELARWTPALHAEAKALADKTYPTGKAAITAAMKSAERMPGDADRDKYRHPAETLAFFGFKPTMTVLDVGPGEGWYTELLAPALHQQGHYLATSGDPNGPPDSRDTFNGERFKAFLDKAPELYGKARTVVVDAKAPKLGDDATFDLVLVMRGTHGMVSNGTLGAWLAEIHRVLKPGGVLGIEEHRAPAGADPTVSAKNGYVPEKWLIAQAEAAGFKLGGASEINANPKDTKDYPDGVWSLPPTFRGGAKDHDKYAAIGESDRMTLKLVKVADKAAPKTSDKAAPKPAGDKTASDKPAAKASDKTASP